MHLLRHLYPCQTRPPPLRSFRVRSSTRPASHSDPRSAVRSAENARSASQFSARLRTRPPAWCAEQIPSRSLRFLARALPVGPRCQRAARPVAHRFQPILRHSTRNSPVNSFPFSLPCSPRFRSTSRTSGTAPSCAPPPTPLPSQRAVPLSRWRPSQLIRQTPCSLPFLPLLWTVCSRPATFDFPNSGLSAQPLARIP